MKYEAKIIDGKMMLISKDIQVGDKFDQFPGINGICYTCKGNANGVLLDDEGKYRVIETCFKVIGEVSSQAIWVKEGDKFELKHFNPLSAADIEHKGSTKQVIRIKGPCGHYH